MLMEDAAPRPRAHREASGWAAASLVSSLGGHAEVTVISPRNYFLFTPMLAGAANLAQFDALPIHSRCSRRNVVLVVPAAMYLRAANDGEKRVDVHARSTSRRGRRAGARGG